MEITMMRHVLSVRRQAREATATTIEDGWVLRRISDLEILTAKIFEQVPWILHGFSTRKGGASRLDGVPALTLGFTDWDSPAAVVQNRNAFVHALAAAKPAAKHDPKVATEPSLITLRQIHSDVVQVFSEASVSARQGDAAISRQNGLHLGIQ